MNRRMFLRRAGSAGAVLGSAALFGTALDACGVTQTSAPTTRGSTAPTATTRPTPPTTVSGPPLWSDLAQSMTGTLVLPTDSSYGADKLLYNERFDAVAPAAIAYCQSPSDVQRCIAFARRSGLPTAIRSGGHSYAGYSSGPGLVVDLSAMANVALGPNGTTAVVGAGTRLIDLYSALGQSGVLVPGGSCPTVGIGGLALGGGIGVFGRNYGLTCDNVASVDVVTAAGQLLTCGPDQHEDLYWACRGGGGGNFGVVTSFTFDVHPIPPIALFTLVWPAEAAGAVLGAWQQWIGSTPNELWSNCQLLSAGPDGIEVRVTGVWCGSTATLSSVLQPLRSAVGSATTDDFVGPESYLRAMLIEAGCEDSTVAQCHLPSQNPAGTLARSAFATKSTFIDAPLSGAGVAAVVESLESLRAAVPEIGGGFVLDSFGGAINQVPADATAFVHRDALADIEYTVNWTSGTSPSIVAAATSWLQSAQEVLGPYAQGSYQNYIDPTLPDWEAAYYGSNLTRLMAVKRAYDPDDYFHFAQSVPLAAPGSP
jgi:FAD/FMN-containing dehydrogenase